VPPLIRRAGLWAREHDLVLDPFVLSAAMDFRHQSVDGRLGRWTTALVQEFLLDWMPRRISARATDLAAAPEALRTFVRYLRDVELDDPTGTPLPELEAAITDAAGRFPAAMSDERTLRPGQVLGDDSYGCRRRRHRLRCSGSPSRSGAGGSSTTRMF
jgi:hypothetical protein